MLCIHRKSVPDMVKESHRLTATTPMRRYRPYVCLLSTIREKGREHCHMQRQTVFLAFLLLASFGRASAWGDEVDSLRASFEHEIAAFNARDLDALMGNQHEHVVALSLASPTLVDGKAARRHAYQTVFATAGSVTVTPRNPQFRVLDNTGIVWGEYAIAAKPKDKPLTTNSVRFTRTYVKSDGQWLLVLYHVSPVPAPQ